MAFYGLNLGTRIRGPAHKLTALLLVQRGYRSPVSGYRPAHVRACQAFPASHLPPAHSRSFHKDVGLIMLRLPFHILHHWLDLVMNLVARRANIEIQYLVPRPPTHL